MEQQENNIYDVLYPEIGIKLKYKHQIIEDIISRFEKEHFKIKIIKDILNLNIKLLSENEQLQSFIK